MSTPDHKCPYGLTLCTADDLCPYCERAALRALVREMGRIISNATGTTGAQCPICVGRLNHWGHLDCCHRLQEIINRPSVKKIMEAPE